MTSRHDPSTPSTESLCKSLLATSMMRACGNHGSRHAMVGMAVPVLLAMALATSSAVAAPATGSQGEAAFTPCPLGSFHCASPPPNFALCRPNALFGFYQPGLPDDSKGREEAPTVVDAKTADTSDPNIYHLNGDVRLQRHDQLLQADHVDYNDKTTAYDARGNVTYQDNGALLSASRIHGSTTPDRAQASDVQYQMLTSRGNGTAEHATLGANNHQTYSLATFSTCDPGSRVWEIRADRLKIDEKTGIGKAYGATMRLWNVPFLYLPYFSFPIDDRRMSGFLYPTISNGSNSGFMFSIPYYLNLAPNYDATITPKIYSKRGVMIGGQFRYLFGFGRGQLDIDYMPSDRIANEDGDGNMRPGMDDNADRYLIDYKHSSPLPGNWNFSTSIRHASDKYYFQDFQSFLDGESTPSQLHSNAYIRGGGRAWDASIGLDHYQNVDPDYQDYQTSYWRWPRITFNADTSLTRHLTVGVNSEAVAFRRERSIEGNRIDIKPWIQADFQGPGWFLRPRLAWRYTGYELANDADHYGYTDHSPTRSLPIASIDSGLIFERDTSLFGNHYTQTLEPRLYYLYTPYRDQDDLPRFDTSFMRFAWWQLFADNRFSGADRQMDANNLTLAVTSRLLDDSGAEKASFGLGQIRYFSPQRVQLYPGQQATDYRGSDYVAKAGWQMNPDWRVNAVYQWNPEQRHTSVGTLQFQRRLGNDGILNFAYRYRDHYMEQFDMSAVYRLNARWRVLGRWNVQLRDRQQWDMGRGDPKTLSALLGVEYDSCCVAVRLLGRHYVRNTRGDTDNAIMLQVQFKGLGSFNPKTERFLHRAILGYQ